MIQEKPFTFTTESTRIRIQMELLLIILNSGGQLWALDAYWTQVGVLTGHSAATADFHWSPLHISVSVRCFDLVFHMNNFRSEGKASFLVAIWAVFFRAILHHLFIELMRHIADVVGKEVVLSLDVRCSAVRRSLSL